MDVRQAQYWFWEFGVTPSPVVDDLWSSNTQSARDFRSIDQVIEIDLPSHGTTVLMQSDIVLECCVRVDALRVGA